MEKLKVRR